MPKRITIATARSKVNKAFNLTWEAINELKHLDEERDDDFFEEDVKLLREAAKKLENVLDWMA